MTIKLVLDTGCLEPILSRIACSLERIARDSVEVADVNQITRGIRDVRKGLEADVKEHTPTTGS